jgi:hypothetical protein
MLKPSEKTFTVTLPDSGTFVFRFPTIRDDFKIDAVASQILDGNLSPSEENKTVATMVATLQTVLQVAPEGFDALGLYDYNELAAIYHAYIEKVFQFRGLERGGNEAAG